MSHAVLVVNENGYWGEGTASNICYARIRGCCGCLEVQLGSGLVPLRSAEFQAPVGPVMSGASTTSTVMVPLMVCNGFKGVLNAMHGKILSFCNFQIFCSKTDGTVSELFYKCAK